MQVPSLNAVSAVGLWLVREESSDCLPVKEKEGGREGGREGWREREREREGVIGPK